MARFSNAARVFGYAASVATLSVAVGAHAEETIKIGLLAPVSGGAAMVGEGIKQGVDLAVKQINDAGGIDGKKVEVLLRDSQIKPDVAAAGARELITKEGVGLIVGPISSGEFAAVSEIAKQEKVVVMAPLATSESITTTNFHDYVFQYPSTTDVNGQRFAEIMKKIGTTSVCFVGYDYSYSHDMLKSMKANMAPIKATGEYLVPVSSTDFSSMVTQLISNECDTIWGGMFGGGFIAFVKQAAPFGLFQSKKIVWGSYLGDYATAAALKGDMPEGMWSSALDAWYYEGSEAHAAYQQAMTEMRGSKETSVNALPAYTLTMFLAAAIKEAGTTDPTAVAKALKGMELDTPVGKVRIDPENHRMNAPEFFGRIATVDGSDVKQMTDIILFD